MSDNIAELMSEIVGKENFKPNAPMSEYTTFKVGGPADYFVLPRNDQDIKAIIELCKKNNIKYFIMGNGSNVLVNDQGYRGAVIQLYENMRGYELSDTTIRVQAGIKLYDLSEILWENSLTGFEFASGIPGTLGGAVSMNAGAYGGEMKDVVISAKVMDENGEIIELLKGELEFGYRTSAILKKNYILLEATLKLEKGEKEVIREKITELSNRRKDKQPLEFPSAGSTFKRPEGHFAGKLIMDSGLAGYRVGNAMVSEKHCGFVINVGGATSKDIQTVINDVSDKVFEKFGVRLEPEVRML